MITLLLHAITATPVASAAQAVICIPSRIRESMVCCMLAGSCRVLGLTIGSDGRPPLAHLQLSPALPLPAKMGQALAAVSLSSLSYGQSHIVFEIDCLPSAESSPALAYPLRALGKIRSDRLVKVQPLSMPTSLGDPQLGDVVHGRALALIFKML